MNSRGFSLVELMVVLVILGILLTIALPAYQGYVTGAKRRSGAAALLATLARQEQYFINNKRYADSLDLLGYASNPYAISAAGDEVSIDSSDRIYLVALTALSLDATPGTFSLQAIPQLAQVKDRQCGVLQLNSLGAKSASAGSLARCW